MKQWDEAQIGAQAVGSFVLERLISHLAVNNGYLSHNGPVDHQLFIYSAACYYGVKRSSFLPAFLGVKVCLQF